MDKKVDLRKDIVYCFIFLILSGFFINKIGENDAVYVVALISVIFIFIFLLSQDRIPIITDKLVYLPIAMMSIWIYGIVLGVLKQNNTAYIIRNFAGNVFYVFFFFLLFLRLDAGKCMKLCLYISRIMIVLTAVAYIDMFVIGTQFVSEIPLLSNFQQAATVEYGAREMVYVSYVYALANFLENRKYRFVNFVWVILCICIEVICIRSGGDTLALMLFTALVIYRFCHNHVKEKKILLMLGISAFIIVAALPGSPIREVFSLEDMGNMRRYNQIIYVFDNLNLLGHGLGAVYLGGVGSEYAIEVIYLDLIHKFGIFSIVFFIAYIITVIEAVKLFFGKSEEILDILPLACMGYLIPSLANPMLFVSVNVISHGMALFYIIYRRKENGEKSTGNRNEFL